MKKIFFQIYYIFINVNNKFDKKNFLNFFQNFNLKQ